MKTKLTLLLFVMASVVFAQRQDFSTRCKEEMKKLAALEGDWKGTATVSGQGGTQTVLQTEHIEWKLQGLVLSLEGTGRSKNASGQEEIAFQAFALVYFDPIEQQFKLKSFVKEGFSTNAYFKILATNKFEWGFDIPAGGKSRYTIIVDATNKHWTETGEYSRDGNTWMKFIELDLTKI
jgi:hypothetical protein